jgi:hypothetical protein
VYTVPLLFYGADARAYRGTAFACGPRDQIPQRKNSQNSFQRNFNLCAGLSVQSAPRSIKQIENKMAKAPYLKWLHEVELSDIPTVGGKNASLGEMIQNLGKLGCAGTWWLRGHRSQLRGIHRPQRVGPEDP